MEHSNGPVVYFAGAIRGNRVAAQVMQEMVRHITQLGFPVLTEHIVMDDPNAILAGKKGITKEKLTARMIEEQDTAWLDSATHVIAEVTGASTGTGREIEYARVKGELGKAPARILCLYQKNMEPSVSAMILGMSKKRYPNITVRSYEDVSETKDIINSFLKLS